MFPFPSPEELPNPGTEPTTPTLAGRVATEPHGKPNNYNLALIESFFAKKITCFLSFNPLTNSGVMTIVAPT